MVPKLLSPYQKHKRISICADVLRTIESVPTFLDRVLTCDGTWILQYDPETKRQFLLIHRERKLKNLKPYCFLLRYSWSYLR